MFNARASGACHVPESGPNVQTDGGPAGLPVAQDAIILPDSDREPTLFAWAGGSDGGVVHDQDGEQRVTVYTRVNDLQGHRGEAKQLDGKLVGPIAAGGLTFDHVADPAGKVMGISTDRAADRLILTAARH